MSFQIGVIRALLDARHVPFQIVLNRRQGYKDGNGFFSDVFEFLKAEFPGITIQIDESPSASAYYQGLRALIQVQSGGRDVELGDLGFTDWMRQLLNIKSERLCISSLSIDRLMQITA